MTFITNVKASKGFLKTGSLLLHVVTILSCALGGISIQAAQFGASATVQKSPTQITVTWDAAPWGSANYTVYRSTTIGGSTGGNGTWTQIASGLTTTSFVDANVQVGTEYEYRINRSGSQFNGDAYLSTGIELPLADSRGKLILVVDNTYTTSLANEISTLQADLAGDGWTVIRYDVSRTSTPASVKSLIQTSYNADPANVKAVFLLGRIPVFRSGNFAPDGHESRSMPSDAYYGDMDGNWGSSPNSLPSDVELQVGRVDLYNMPAFSPLTDTDLTRQYLTKDHNFRHKVFTVSQRQAQMTSATGNSIQRQFFGTALPTNIPNNYYAANGYYSPEFWSEIQNNDYMWFTKGTGGGQYTACTGMGSTYHYAASPGVKTVFNTTFASWFVEWDVTDNFLRAPLAAKGYALCNAWSDLPAWVFQHMGMGKNIGYSTRLSQNNNTYYNIIGYPDLPAQKRGVHIALMGDPSLRMHIVAPPANLNALSAVGIVNLSWAASSESRLQGYALYRSTSANGPFTRVNSALVTGTSYTDSNVPNGSYVYMVRAVKLETVPSGSYFNGSQGIFKSVSVNGGIVNNQAPVVNAGNALTLTLPAFAALAGTVIDDNLPALPLKLTSTWSKVSGPGTVTFGSASLPITTASFSTSGTYVLRLTANDGALASSDDVTITVNPARNNNVPVANSQSISMNVNAIRVVTLTASDADADPLTYSIVATPAHGTLTGTAPNLTYTPQDGYIGSDSFTFKVNDTYADSAVATVYFAINSVNNSQGSDVVAMFHLDNDYSDATGLNGNITTANNARFDSSKSTSGSALRVFDVYDRGIVNIPLPDLHQNGQAVSISIEAQLFINRYSGYSLNNASLLSLVKGWNSQILLSEDKWAPSAAIIGGNQTLVNYSTLASSLSTGRWNQVSIMLSTNGYQIKVNGNQIAQVASGDLGNWSGTGNATLQFGDFDGWVDEVVVRSSKAGSPTTPPPVTLPTVTVAATDATATENGNNVGTFTFSRSGSTTQPLTVNFTLGGTARYGSNYAGIPTAIIIPAGASTVNGIIQPLRDNTFTGPLTVSLTLSTNSAYQPGNSASATITINDSDKPKLNFTASSSASALGSAPNQLQLSAGAVTGVAYLLQSSTNLIDWKFIATNQAGASLNFTAPISAGQTNLYYRTLYVFGSVSAANISSALASRNFSANAVGFANVIAPPGFSLVANPLNTSSNYLNNLLSYVPNNTQIYKFNGQDYSLYIFQGSQGQWSSNPTLNPGEGVFLANPTRTNLTLTFTGEVLQGTLTNALPSGFSIKGSLVPQSGPLGGTLLGLPGTAGDTVYRFLNGQYVMYIYLDDQGWYGGEENLTPSLKIGEAFYLYKNSPANWVRSFSVTN